MSTEIGPGAIVRSERSPLSDAAMQAIAASLGLVIAVVIGVLW